MKKLTQFAAMAALVVGLSYAQAAEKIEAGPKGGRLLNQEAPRAEFFVEQDRMVSITFYDKSLKPVAPAEQVVTAIADIKGAKTKLEFEKKNEALVSKTALPEGENYTVIVQVREKPEAKPKNFRIPLDLSTCGGCDRAEYACTCHE